MSLVRPAALATLSRWREVALSAATALLGLWIATRGGPILAVAGLALAALAGGLALTALRRLRFAQDIAAPGLVEVVEGEVRYFGPSVGGTVSLSDLTELRLIVLRGHRMWRLKQADGQALLIPVDAAGAESLFDGFASLPGIDLPAVLAALSPVPSSATASGPGQIVAGQPDMIVLWHRGGRGPTAMRPLSPRG